MECLSDNGVGGILNASNALGSGRSVAFHFVFQLSRSLSKMARGCAVQKFEGSAVSISP